MSGLNKIRTENRPRWKKKKKLTGIERCTDLRIKKFRGSLKFSGLETETHLFNTICIGMVFLSFFFLFLFLRKNKSISFPSFFFSHFGVVFFNLLFRPLSWSASPDFNTNKNVILLCHEA
jgi:hypothetical protein